MIQTKIAQILSPTRFVLAAGADQGVREGMEFIIYELSDPIFDPETKEPLGQLELHKGRVKVLHVQDKLATATTLPRKLYRPSFLWVEECEELPIDQTTATAVKSDLTVKVGDLVRSLN
jgi:hypothetical protein